MDRVLCFYCNGGLKDWGSEDQPWLEHATWFPYCKYLLQKKGLFFVETVHTLISEVNITSVCKSFRSIRLQKFVIRY
jgi:hypothetical protein